jgi:predicted O-linked N-acetylglucosamine transferase (SPINDLY family)
MRWSALMDAKGFTEDVEEAYRGMWRKYLSRKESRAEFFS